VAAVIAHSRVTPVIMTRDTHIGNPSANVLSIGTPFSSITVPQKEVISQTNNGCEFDLIPESNSPFIQDTFYRPPGHQFLGVAAMDLLW
jgi:hypothetical protein